MPIATDAWVIGLTGPFGSGCSTSAELLSQYCGFIPIRLSQVLKDEWAKRSREPFTRQNLQELGDELRKEHGTDHLARLACESISGNTTQINRLVVDGIRNIGEVNYLRQRFGLRFFLFALECQKSQRWMRSKPSYEKTGQTQEDFSADDRRDRDEEVLYGQQVQLCVDNSDVLIINDDEVPRAALRDKLAGFVRLVTAEEPRYARPEEILMNLAYSASHGSKCLKRQVGAVLVNAAPGVMGEIVGTGFNENPSNTSACIDEPKYGADPSRGIRGGCYRDMVRYDSFVKLSNEKRLCPACGTPMVPPTKTPPWRCSRCGAHFEDFFWPERAMSWCTAIHAEVAALLSAGHRARGTTLYTTSFPCFQCAEKIAQAGVAAIAYTEPYPDVKAGERIEIAGIPTARFEGVRSSRFHEIFSKVRPYFEAVRA